MAGQDYYWYPELSPGLTWPEGTPKEFDHLREYCAEAGYTLYLLGKDPLEEEREIADED